jgi:hypothetical protein
VRLSGAAARQAAVVEYSKFMRHAWLERRVRIGGRPVDFRRAQGKRFRLSRTRAAPVGSKRKKLRRPTNLQRQIVFAMKHTLLSRLPWVVLSSLLLIPSVFATTPPTAVPGTLKVQVNVPATWHWLADDRVAEPLVDQLRDTFYRAGFDRPIEQITYVEDPAKAPYLLTINLVDWRMNHAGSIDCTFSANLQTPRGTRDFGLFSDMAFNWIPGRGRYGLSQAFTQAADGALKQLCDAVAKSEMLPDFRKPELVSGLPEGHRPSA